MCVLGDHKHCEEAKSLGIDAMTVEDLKKLNKNKKLVKKLGEAHEAHLIIHCIAPAVHVAHDLNTDRHKQSACTGAAATVSQVLLVHVACIALLTPSVVSAFAGGLASQYDGQVGIVRQMCYLLCDCTHTMTVASAMLMARVQ